MMATMNVGGCGRGMRGLGLGHGHVYGVGSPKRGLGRGHVYGLGVAMTVAVALSGCGDPCEDAVTDLCEQACDCEGTAACSTTFGGSNGGLTLGFDDVDDCAAFFSLGCEDGVEDQIDGEACQAAVSGGTSCTDEGLTVPSECGG